jgi:hypothetical protein
MFHTSTSSLPPNHSSTSLAGLRLRSARLQLPSCAFHCTILTWRRCVPFATAWLNSCSKWNQLLYTLQSWKNSEITIDHCHSLPNIAYIELIHGCGSLVQLPSNWECGQFLHQVIKILKLPQDGKTWQDQEGSQSRNKMTRSTGASQVRQRSSQTPVLCSGEWEHPCVQNRSK